jgi:predicted sugar kinase
VYAITDQPARVEAAAKSYDKDCTVIRTKARNKGAEIERR